jgi:hypothetical protein
VNEGVDSAKGRTAVGRRAIVVGGMALTKRSDLRSER